MKIHEVSYIAADDLTKHHFFSNKPEAVRVYNRLKKVANKAPIEDAHGDKSPVIKCLFDINTFDVEISKKGILNMLNSQFNETQ